MISLCIREISLAHSLSDTVYDSHDWFYKIFYFYILGKSIGGRGHKISDYFEVSHWEISPVLNIISY